MPSNHFDRDSMAQQYAGRHLKTDPAIRTILYLPAQAPDREIRFIEVNDSIAERNEFPLEPIDFGVDVGASEGHRLIVLDVTPAQWEKIEKKELQLPKEWSLDGAVQYPREK
jgi:hypothetical protein